MKRKKQLKKTSEEAALVHYYNNFNKALLSEKSFVVRNTIQILSILYSTIVPYMVVIIIGEKWKDIVATEPRRLGLALIALAWNNALVIWALRSVVVSAYNFRNIEMRLYYAEKGLGITMKIKSDDPILKAKEYFERPLNLLPEFLKPNYDIYLLWLLIMDVVVLIWFFHNGRLDFLPVALSLIGAIFIWLGARQRIFIREYAKKYSDLNKSTDSR